MRRGLKDHSPSPTTTRVGNSSIFPDEEGTESIMTEPGPLARRDTAASSPMRRGLKAGAPVSCRAYSNSSIFPDEEGTESAAAVL